MTAGKSKPISDSAHVEKLISACDTGDDLVGCILDPGPSVS